MLEAEAMELMRMAEAEVVGLGLVAEGVVLGAEAMGLEAGGWRWMLLGVAMERGDAGWWSWGLRVEHGWLDG
ncbi:MAG: hypothetical protein M3464_15605 [Chloroflexota bacterium]|nr:hypothetical protein [Chloroflexota bacterium]